MKTMREKFEGLEKIKDILDEYKSDVITFDYEKDEYNATLYVTFVPEYIEWLNGAWYAFQEQEKKIDAIEKWIKDNMKSIPLEYNGYTTEEYVDADELLELLNESQPK